MTEKPLSRSDVVLRCEQAIESKAGLTVVHIQTPAAPVALDLVKQKYCLVTKDLGRSVPPSLVSLWRKAPRRVQGWFPNPVRWEQHQRQCAFLLPFLTPLSDDSMKVLLDASRRNSDVSSAARDSLRTIARQARPACEKLTNQFPELKVFLDQTRPPPTKTTNKH